jgi:hypothetical protein
MIFSRRKTRLFGDDLDYSGPNQVTPENDKGGAETMTRATTMLELCELHDMLRLGEEMAPVPRSSSRHDDDDENGYDERGFYIDPSDGPLEEEPDAAVVAGEHLSTEWKSFDSRGLLENSLRRTKSAASLTTLHRLRTMDLSHDMTHSKVDDEGETLHEDLMVRVEQCYNASLQQSGKELCMPLNDLPLSPHVSKTNQSRHSDSYHSTDVIPPRQSTSLGMPLRSNLRGSNYSLGCLIGNSHGSENSTNNPGMKRNVSFSSIEIRSYAVTLGDAPTSSGPPISLDWKYNPAETRECTVDAYESEVNNESIFSHQVHDDDPPISRQRRVRRELWMTPIDRQYLLMREWGYSRNEIDRAMKEARKVSQRRAQTAKKAKMGLEPLEEALEKARKRVTSVGRSLNLRT